MSHFGESIHLGQNVCTLCRKQVEEGSMVLVSHRAQHIVKKCPCYCPKPTSSWCHKPCRDILALSYGTAQIPALVDLENFHEAIKSLYTPLNERKRVTSSIVEGLFSDHTRRIMDGFFRQELLEKVPAEVLAMILEYIEICPPYLRILGESRRLMERLRNADDDREERLVDLTKTIYLTRIEYQGISYISTISSMSSSTKTLPDESLTIPSNTREVILSRDHVGIRNIQFLNVNSDPLEDGSQWCENIGLSRSLFDLGANVQHNGLFLRGFHLYTINTQKRLKGSVWSSPRPPTTNPSNFRSISDPNWFHYVPLDSEIKGLAVCCSNGKNIGIHAHYETSKDYDIFVKRMKQRSTDDHMCFMFFPINTGESIRQAWLRKMGTLSVLVLLTTRLRTITFGPHMPFDMRQHVEFYPLLNAGDGAIAGIYHNGLDPKSKYISALGVTCDSQRPTENKKFEPNPETRAAILTEPTCDSPGFTWYMTAAPLQSLSGIQICRDRNKSHNPCIGLLLYYEDGSVEALGQIRWDLEISDKILAPIRIQYSRNADNLNHPYVANVQESRRSNCNTVKDGWQEIPDQGTIVWWFGWLGDKVVVFQSLDWTAKFREGYLL